MKKMWLSLALALTLAAGPALAQSTWYVGPGGVDAPGNGGAPGTPCATVTYVLNTLVADGDTIEILAGEYNQSFSVNGKQNITLRGAAGLTTVFKPLTPATLLTMNGYTNRYAVMEIVNSDGIVLDGIKVDMENVKGNSRYVLHGYESSGTVQNCHFLNNNLPETQGGYTEIGTYFHSDAGPGGGAHDVWNVINNRFEDLGRVFLLTHRYVHTIVENNVFVKNLVKADFGYGIEVGGWSTAEIRNNYFSGFGVPALSDGSGSAALYIEHAFTGTCGSCGPTITNPTPKQVIVEGNVVENCETGVYVGIAYEDYAGNVQIEVIYNDNVVQNCLYGMILEEVDGENGASVSLEGAGNEFTNCPEGGIWILGGNDTYGGPTSDGNISLDLSYTTFNGCEPPVAAYDAKNDGTSTFTVTLENCNFLNYGATGAWSNVANPPLVLNMQNNWWGDENGPDPGAITGNVDTSNPLIQPQPEDTDGDGIPDWREIQIGTDPNNPDSDGDGVSDGAELARGSDPTQPPDPLDPGYNPDDYTDDDGDGLVNSLDPNSANPDTDGDGYADGAEYEAGGLAMVTNPALHPDLGDMNRNGRIDNIDAIIIFQTVLGSISWNDFATVMARMNVDQRGAGASTITYTDAIVAFDFFLGNVNLVPQR